MSSVRIPSIDLFRGLSIALMVFFSVSYWMSLGLPDFLKHNKAGMLHIGDFVLPMFLFASGMSLVFFHEKRKERKDYWLDVIERFGKLAMIALVLSIYSAGAFLGMDEIMLSTLLFLASIVLIRFPDSVIAAVTVFPPLIYLAMMHLNALPDFNAAYLGGYPAAVFYLPVMLAGVLTGKRIFKDGEKADLSMIAIGSMAAYLALSVIVPPFKMAASPSYMALSIAVSLFVFETVKRCRNDYLEYLGKRAMRCWLIMYFLILIPLAFYAMATTTGLPLNFVPWWAGILGSMVCILLIFLVSKALDRFAWLEGLGI